MTTVTIDIINQKALRLLEDLELLQLIRLRREKKNDEGKIDWKLYKGAMQKQPIEQVDQQLNQLRQDWE
jgi:hypothetical protein